MSILIFPRAIVLHPHCKPLLSSWNLTSLFYMLVVFIAVGFVVLAIHCVYHADGDVAQVGFQKDMTV